LRSWLYPPVLRLDLLSVAGEAVRIDYKTIQNGQLFERSVNARYYHLHVRNTRNFPAATDVQVLITRIEIPGPSGDPQLAYVGELPLRWRHQEIYPILRKIDRATDADLFYVTDELLLRFTPLLVPNNFVAEYRGPSRFWITAVAHGTEAASNVIRIEVAWDGQWDPGEAEMQRHLTIRVP